MKSLVEKEGWVKIMTKKIIQQSKNWDNYINKKIKLDENQFYKEGFPKYVYGNNGLLTFKLILCNGDVIEKAYVDLSQQYMAEGTQWRNVVNENVVYDYWVAAWKETTNE